MTPSRLSPEAHHRSTHEYPGPVTDCPRCRFDMQVCLGKEHLSSHAEAMLRVRVVTNANREYRDGQRVAVPYWCRWCPVTRGVPGWHLKTRRARSADPAGGPSDVEA